MSVKLIQNLVILAAGLWQLIFAKSLAERTFRWNEERFGVSLPLNAITVGYWVVGTAFVIHAVTYFFGAAVS